MNPSVLLPRESAKFVVEHSQQVSINAEGVKSLSEKISNCMWKSPYSMENWQKHKLHPKQADDAAIEWIFVADLLNFSFWPEDGADKFRVKYKDDEYTGYWSMCAVINRALDQGVPLTSAAYFSQINEPTMEILCRSETETSIPLLNERVRLLNESGKIIMDKFDGSFVTCVKQANGSAVELLKLIVENFASFRDEAIYKGQKVSFYKRAQILVADVWACCQGQGLGSFSDIDQITMFADYRVPQALVYFDVLRYSDQLMDKLKKGERLEQGSEDEVEIRASTIWAVELIAQELKRHTTASTVTMNSILVDFYLWDYRRSHADDMDHIPFHKTRTIYY